MAAELGGDVSAHASALDYTVAPEQPLSSVDWHGHTGLVVVDAEGRPVGVLSDKNVTDKASSSLTVRDVMTPHPITILETAPVAIAAALMKDHGA
jgi:CBS domain-containing protein